MEAPHIDEDLHPDEGYWITRRKLYKHPNDPLKNRGDHYFHSTYNDLVISGLVGVQVCSQLSVPIVGFRVSGEDPLNPTP